LNDRPRRNLGKFPVVVITGNKKIQKILPIRKSQFSEYRDDLRGSKVLKIRGILYGPKKGSATHRELEGGSKRRCKLVGGGSDQKREHASTTSAQKK